MHLSCPCKHAAGAIVCYKCVFASLQQSERGFAANPCIIHCRCRCRAFSFPSVTPPHSPPRRLPSHTPHTFTTHTHRQPAQAAAVQPRAVPAEHREDCAQPQPCVQVPLLPDGGAPRQHTHTHLPRCIIVKCLFQQATAAVVAVAGVWCCNTQCRFCTVQEVVLLLVCLLSHVEMRVFVCERGALVCCWQWWWTN